MRPALALVLLFLSPALLCPQDADATKLRQAARLPQLTSFGGIGFKSNRKFHLAGETTDYRQELVAFQRLMRGNAGDAENYLEMARCHFELDDKPRAEQALNKARELFEQQVQTDAKNAAALRGLGQTFALLDKHTDAEKALRSAVEVAPRDWESRAALGRFYDNLAIETLTGCFGGKEGFDIGKILAVALGRKPDGAALKRVRELSDAARTCFDQAVTLAPNEAGAFVERGMARTLEGSILGMLKVIEGNRAINPIEAMYAPECIADFKQAARLDPTNYRLLGYVAMMEVTAAQAAGQPEQAVPTIRVTLAQLEKLSQSNNPEVAGGATEVMGFLQVFALGQVEPAIKNYRRVVALNPGRDSAWEMLTACLAQAGRFDEMLVTCQKRVEAKDSLRARICLAKGYEAMNQLDKAEAEVRAALRQDRDSVLANLSLSALLLRNGRDANALASAGDHLDRIESKLTDESPEYTDFRLTQSIQRALNGDPAGARQIVEDLLKSDPDNPRVKAVLAALPK